MIDDKKYRDDEEMVGWAMFIFSILGIGTVVAIVHLIDDLGDLLAFSAFSISLPFWVAFIHGIRKAMRD